MQVTSKDESNEREILKIVRNETSVFDDIKFLQGKGASVYDFWGYKDKELVVGVDVKVRKNGSKDFKNYFISVDKVEMINEKPELTFFVIFFFKKDSVLRMYNLVMCDLKRETINFTHKRTGKLMNQEVFTIPAFQHCFDAILFTP